MLRLLSCQRATLLIEQRTAAALPPAGRNSLWLHLAYCPYCRRYACQTVLLNRLAQAAATPRGESVRLSAAAKQRLQHRLFGDAAADEE